MEQIHQDTSPTHSESATTRTLHRALVAHGGVTRLAEALGVSVEDLVHWMNGDAIAPHSVFLRALELAYVEQKVGSLYDVNDPRHKRL